MYESRGPAEDRFGYSTQGIFNCARKTERIALMITVSSTLFLAFAGYAFFYMQFEWYRQNTYSPARAASTFGYIYVAFLAVTVIIAWIIISLILSGNVYKYRADATHFSFLSEKARVRKTDIYYNDVVMVKFEEYRLFGKWLRGFYVTIVTRSLGNITFSYIFNKSITDKTPQNTPFFIIAERTQMYLENTVR